MELAIVLIAILSSIIYLMTNFTHPYGSTAKIISDIVTKYHISVQ